MPAGRSAPLCALVLCLGLASCVQASQAAEAGEGNAGPRQCFSLHRVTGFSEAGRDRLKVLVGNRDAYEFTTVGSCPELDFAQGLALKTRSNSSQICDRHDVDLIVPSTIGPPQRCMVRMIRKLGPEEVRGKN